MTFSNYSFTWMIREYVAREYVFMQYVTFWKYEMIFFFAWNWALTSFINVSKLNLFCEESIWFWLFFVGPKTGFKFLLKVFFLGSKSASIRHFLCRLWNNLKLCGSIIKTFWTLFLILVLKLQVFEYLYWDMHLLLKFKI